MRKLGVKALAAALAICFLMSFRITLSASGISVSVSAESAALINLENGDVYFAKNASARLPMASTTKIMTALVALENSEIDDTVIIDRRAVGVEGSSVYLTEGELLTMENLLYALLLASANDAAAAIAIEVGGSIEGFAQLMNEKAKDLGLENTHFENPHGLDSEEHYTSALDLAKITAAAMKNESFAKIVSTYKSTIPCNGGSRVLINHNKLLRSYDGAVGVKTGFTKRSGRCLVSAAERNGMTLIAVTINAPDDWNDHREMLDGGFNAYHKVKVTGKGEYIINIPVIGGTDETVLCSNANEISAVLPSSVSTDMCKLTLEAPRMLYTPVKEGDIIGKLVCYENGKVIGESEIKAEYSVKAVKYKLTLWERIKGFFSNIFN
ncbi:MAG: D-alanyl-D-alanine carboxypeptidase family protein [Clostridia bacterium]|nr:D-alanyl-D-alanine carboxypeptidase family protein [Clostridia bacterium]